jgi:hypothetical protein
MARRRRRRPRKRPLPSEAERLPASPAAALSGDGPPPLPEEGWIYDRTLPALIFGLPTAFIAAGIAGALLTPPLVGLGLCGTAVLGAVVSATAGYVSLHRRWRQVGEHARALGALVVARSEDKDPRAEEAWRLMTVARSHRSVRALPRARERLEALHDQVLEAK